MYEKRPHLPPDRRHSPPDDLPTTGLGIIRHVFVDALSLGLIEWIAGLAALALIGAVAAVLWG